MNRLARCTSARNNRAALLGLTVGAATLVAGCGSAGAGGKTDDPLGDQISKGSYQAVTLTSDELYFGKLRWTDRGFYELRDAYFIRRTTPAATVGGKTPQSQLKVEPVGKQIGTDGDVLINASEIVQVQNLRKDSAVAEAIADLEE